MVVSDPTGEAPCARQTPAETADVLSSTPPVSFLIGPVGHDLDAPHDGYGDRNATLMLKLGRQNGT